MTTTTLVGWLESDGDGWRLREQSGDPVPLAVEDTGPDLADFLRERVSITGEMLDGILMVESCEVAL